MSKYLEKYKVKEEKNMENIINDKIGKKIFQDLLISYGTMSNNIILFDLKLKKKILDITFHNNGITSIHICTKHLYIDDKETTFSTNSFHFLSSSLDKKFALHNISYNNLTSEYSNYKLIAQYKPTRDEINDVIQIENGQILVATRDQSLILFSNKINNGNFIKLFEINKNWPMEVSTLFEIRNNLIGVSWDYDDAEADETFDEETETINHSNDGIYIYLIDKNEIINKKFLKIKTSGIYFHAVIEDKLILKGMEYIVLYNLNNFELMFKFKVEYSSKLYPFNEKYFILFYNENSEAIFKLYNVNSMKNEQTIEVQGNLDKRNLFPISNKEYVFNDLIITFVGD